MLNILLAMVGYAILHSITADKRVKAVCMKLVGRRTYEGFYRLIYNALSIILLIPILMMVASSHTELYRVTGSLAILFEVVRAIGGIGAAVSLLQIDLLRFAGIRQLIAWIRNEPLPLVEEPLQTNGLYQFVRHPLYFFSLLALWFTPSMSHGSFAFNIGVTLYFIVGSWIEERRLGSAFGSEYEQYQQRIPALIPFPRPKNDQSR